MSQRLPCVRVNRCRPLDGRLRAGRPLRPLAPAATNRLRLTPAEGVVGRGHPDLRGHLEPPHCQARTGTIGHPTGSERPGVARWRPDPASDATMAPKVSVTRCRPKGKSARPAAGSDGGRACHGWSADHRGRVSTPLRRCQRQRHQSRQYLSAPRSVSAPSASSVPHRARVSERAIRVSIPAAPPPASPRSAACAVSTPNQTRCRPSYGRNGLTCGQTRTRRLGRTGRLSRERAHCPRVRVDRGPTGRRPLSPLLHHSANGPDGRPPPRT